MPGNAENNYQEWLKKAEEDEYAGGEILGGGRFPAPACFHFQQMVEKLLKGLLIRHNRPFPKVHDLLELETLLMDSEPEIRLFHENLKLLNGYYVETRYPGDYPEFTLEECAEAQKAALRVKEFVSERIGK